ncbi:MAG TPA: hypothetical protein VG318_10795, partial [Actinomycetota bacterium]|nr:hypothetical protein [Actinomycetota bacterium]
MRRNRVGPQLPEPLRGRVRARIFLDGVAVGTVAHVEAPVADTALRRIRAVSVAAVVAGVGGDVAQAVAGGGETLGAVKGRTGEVTVLEDGVVTAGLHEWASGEIVRPRKLGIVLYDDAGFRSSTLKLRGAHAVVYEAEGAASSGVVRLRRLVLVCTDTSWIVDSIEAAAGVTMLMGRDSPPPAPPRRCLVRGAAGAAMMSVALVLASGGAPAGGRSGLAAGGSIDPLAPVVSDGPRPLPST